MNVVNDNYLINKFANLTIKTGNENNLIDKVANMTIKNVGNDLNREKASDVQVQFADGPSGKTHQNLLSSRMIGIRNK